MWTTMGIALRIIVTSFRSAFGMAILEFYGGWYAGDRSLAPQAAGHGECDGKRLDWR
jgi:hypothetical protein